MNQNEISEEQLIEIRKNIDKCVQLSNEIFNELRTKELKELNAEMKYKYAMEKYPNFVKAYPIQTMYIAMYHIHDPDLFREYLNNPPRKLELFVEYQSDYALKISQKFNPNLSKAQLKNIRDITKKN